MLARGSQTWITVGRLHHTSDTLGIQAVHNPFVRNQRDITEDMHFEANGFWELLFCLGDRGGCRKLSSVLAPYSFFQYVSLFDLPVVKQSRGGTWANVTDDERGMKNNLFAARFISHTNSCYHIVFGEDL